MAEQADVAWPGQLQRGEVVYGAVGKRGTREARTDVLRNASQRKWAAAAKESCIGHGSSIQMSANVDRSNRDRSWCDSPHGAADHRVSPGSNLGSGSSARFGSPQNRTPIPRTAAASSRTLPIAQSERRRSARTAIQPVPAGSIRTPRGHERPGKASSILKKQNWVGGTPQSHGPARTKPMRPKARWAKASRSMP